MDLIHNSVGFLSANSGTTGLPADGTAAYDVYGVTLYATGGASTLILNDSPDGTGTNVVQIDAALNTATTVVFPYGIRFETGIYVNADGNQSTCAVFYRKI